eukprot:252915-Hanusia_phi.AAC.2
MDEKKRRGGRGERRAGGERGQQVAYRIERAVDHHDLGKREFVHVDLAIQLDSCRILSGLHLPLHDRRRSLEDVVERVRYDPDRLHARGLVVAARDLQPPGRENLHAEVGRARKGQAELSLMSAGGSQSTSSSSSSTYAKCLRARLQLAGQPDDAEAGVHDLALLGEDLEGDLPLVGREEVANKRHRPNLRRLGLRPRPLHRWLPRLAVGSSLERVGQRLVPLPPLPLPPVRHQPAGALRR